MHLQICNFTEELKKKLGGRSFLRFCQNLYKILLRSIFAKAFFHTISHKLLFLEQSLIETVLSDHILKKMD